MTELLTAAQMRAIEQAAIESGAVTGLELMERAGQGVVEAVFDEWPELAEGTHRAVVLCGPGNNGGDGFVVARLLHVRGWDVEVFFYGDAEKLPPDAKTNYGRWASVGSVNVWSDNTIEDRLDQVDGLDRALVVDALFGTGIKRTMPDDTERAWHGFVPTVLVEPPTDRTKFVAVDVPSGLCSDSGCNFGAFPADLTVTFHARKVGQYLLRENHYGGGPGLCGRLVVRDIGLDHTLPKDWVRYVDGEWFRKPKFAGQNKFDHGHALILSGGPGRTGAARLAARGALRMGAGLVTLGVPPAAQMEVASQITALMLARVADAGALEAVLEDERINALCLGPGLGLQDHAASLVDAVLGGGHLRLTRRVVFDADALTLIAAEPTRMEMLNEHAVLTPHGGEFARLFPDIAEKLNTVPDRGPAYSKVDATRDAAARCGAIVLFKGPDTVIAHPDGRCSVHAAAYDREAPWLATAGAGDVLAGFITGLLARGFDPMAACETAAWLHVECARAFGPGLIAEDLPEMLPSVLKDLRA